MSLSSENYDRLETLLDRGVKIPHPDSVYVAPEVGLDRVAADAWLGPGTRLLGAGTWIGAGARLGEEAPVTVEDCQVGPRAALKGGSFRRSTLLEEVSMGSGAQVREGCLLEEESSGAHCVGLKQTVLFPCVTLGSLINFCDCLMAGGTSRRDHSEVGSSYIHFNFTPHQDKATPSRFGDVPRGVMLDRAPIFLGGQGGAVGPVWLGFGTVVPAGVVVRRDCPEGGRLLAGEPAPAAGEFRPGLYRRIGRIVRRNLEYVGDLHALRCWYDETRRPFLAGAFEPLFAGAVQKLDLALEERLRRLKDLASRLERSIDLGMAAGLETVEMARQQELYFHREEVVSRLHVPPPRETGARDRDRFLRAVDDGRRRHGDAYRAVIQGLAAEDRAAGVRWLDAVAEAVRSAATDLLPSH